MNGNKLQEIKEKHGISRRELADIILTNESMVQSWEQGWEIQPPSSGEIESMAECFNLSEDDLLLALEIDEEDLSDRNELSFVDFLDAGVRAYKFVKKNKL